MHVRAVVPILVCWLSVAFATALPYFAADTPPAPLPFSHKNHVQENWTDPARSGPEVYRDCRGCHRFAADNPTSSPQAHCDDCHVGAGQLGRRFEPGWEQDLQPYASRTGPAFRHHTHGMLECRECHNERRLFAHLPIETGPGQCARCHAPGLGADAVQDILWFEFDGIDTAAGAAALGLPAPFSRPQRLERDLTAYAQKLHEVFAGPNGGLNAAGQLLPLGGDFDHADHIDTTGAGDGIACSVCHTDIETAAATEVGTGQIPVDGCAACHIRAVDAPARAAGRARQEQRPLHSLGAFAHADHYGFLAGQRHEGVANADAYTDIQQDSCKACHTYEPDVAGFSPEDFPFRGDLSRHRYQDCVVCHSLPGWQTGESESQPLHTSNGGDGWRACADCHELGKPDLASVRPMVAVRRQTERTFVFPANTHPDITQLGRDRTEGREPLDCTECHRNTVPALSSRLVERVFDHDVHLPPQAAWEPANCTGCHPRAAEAATSVALADSEAFRTYTLTSCSQCHWGGEVVERVDVGESLAALAVERQAVTFPHGVHVQKHQQNCASCHVLADDGRDIATLPAANDCSQCHDHVDGDDDSEYEGLFGFAGSCVECHHEQLGGREVASAPPPRGSPAAADDPRYNTTQSVFAGFRDHQFHPAGNACTECHMPNRGDDGERVLAAIQRPTGTDHLLVDKPGGVHAGRNGVGAQPYATLPQCLQCHWTAASNMAIGVRQAPGDPAAKDRRKVPASRATREEFGNRFENYPGLESEG